MPQISVIVPVYKVEKYINRCIDSILAQTFTDFELILVDDGSPDNCGAICDDYAAKDFHVHVIHQKNGGLSAARNAGIDWAFDNSDSEWLSFIDSDDWVHPKYLEALYHAAKHSGSDIVIGGFERTEGKNPSVDETKLEEIMWNVEEFYSKHNVTATVAWGKIYCKNCFEDIRYPVGKLHEDEYVTYRILFGYKQIAVVNQALYAYYQNPHGIIHSEWNPKRMDALLAQRNQIIYFRKYHYANADAMVSRNYINNITTQLQEAKRLGCNSEYHRLKLLLKKEMLFCRKQYPFSKDKWYYEIAFPTAMRLYWICHSKLCAK